MGIFDNIFNRKPTSGATETTRKKREIAKKTIKQQLYRFNQEITDWKIGLEAFEDPFNHTNVDLIRVYNDLVIDAHLSALIETRVSKILSKEFKFINDKGEEIEDETLIFQKAWFRDFLRLALESRFFGFSLIQFDNRAGKCFDGVELVPREYVNAMEKGVRQSPYSNEPLTPYDRGEFMPWLLGVGKPKDSGLLMKTAPIVIYKKTALGSWTEFTELFGTPFRLGKTDVRDEELADNMYSMLENMGRNAFGVFNKDDSLEFISESKNDAHQVYNQLIERCNSELSKLVLGSTMTMDDGSSRSQSEVHERTTNAILKDDAFFVADVVNNQLIPFLNRFHNFNLVGKWVFDDAEQTTKEEQFKRDIEFLKLKMNVPKSYLTETYGTPFDDDPEEPGDEPDETDDDDGNDDDDPKGPKGQDDDTEAENSLKKKTGLVNTWTPFTGGNSHGPGCEATNVVDQSDFADPEFEDEFVDDILRGIYAGTYTLTNLPVPLYDRIADYIMGGVYAGIDIANKTLGTIPDPAFVQALQNNAFVFSGAKTFNQVKEMSDFLLDENGELRTFAEFKRKAGKVFDTYNKNWLKTEYAHASASAQMASKWQQFEEEKDIFPMLKYKTAGDDRVRPSHKALDGVIKPVDSPFWDTHTPQNGWNCRCNVTQVVDGVETPDNAINLPDDIPDYMKHNPGKTKQLFSPEHPYFIVEPQFTGLRDNNFGLPSAPQKPVKGISTIKKDRQAEVIKELKQLQKQAQREKTLDPALVFTTLGDDLKKQAKNLIDNQDGAGRIANKFNTSIGLRGPREVGSKGARTWQQVTGANNRQTLEALTEGHCSVRNIYVNVKVKKGQTLEFKPINFEHTVDDLLASNPLIWRGADGKLWKRVKKGSTSSTLLGKIKPDGKIKFFGTSEAHFIESNSVAPTFTHEINHLIHNQYDPKTLSGNRPKTSALAQQNGVRLRDSVTLYGETNWSEFFAENLTVYIHSNDYMKQNHRKTFDFIETLLDDFGIDKKTFKLAK